MFAHRRRPPKPASQRPRIRRERCYDSHLADITELGNLKQEIDEAIAYFQAR
jgi:hypothetical protein